MIGQGHGRSQRGLRQTRQKECSTREKNGSGFARSAFQTEDNACQNTRQGFLQNNAADGLPAGCASEILTVRKACGTARNASSEVLMITGRVMIESVSEAARMDVPNCRNKTNNPKPNNP